MPSWLRSDGLPELPDDVLRRPGRFADPAIPSDYEISPIQAGLGLLNLDMLTLDIPLGLL
jgi:hypothetical protein